MKRLRFIVLLAIFGWVFLTSRCATAQDILTDFVNHGLPLPISQSHGILAMNNSNGTPLIVAVARAPIATGIRSSLIVIDATNGNAQQYWFPTRDVANGEVFSLMRGPDEAGPGTAKAYLTIGNTFLEFDVNTRTWTYPSPIASNNINGPSMAFTRMASNGLFYFITSPNCWLYSFNPVSNTLTQVAQLDTTQNQPTYLEAGTDGWIYAGIGTVRGTIKAYNTADGTINQLVEETTRTTGSPYVFKATDGNIYGREFTPSSGRLMLLANGASTFVANNPPNPTRASTGAINWGNMLSGFPMGGAITNFSLANRTATVLINGVSKTFTFSFDPGAISESRGIMGVADSNGKRLIVTVARDLVGAQARSSLLVIEASTGKTDQYFYPNATADNGETYCLMRGADTGPTSGKVYMAFGNAFLEFDINTRAWTYPVPPSTPATNIDGQPQAFTRMSNGMVYFATYPDCFLYSFNPTTKVLTKIVQLDSVQKYPTYLEAGTDGWVYAGIGTERGNIMAYNSADGTLNQLVTESARTTGTSYVFKSTDGNIYGREFSTTSGRLMTLAGGAASFVANNPSNPTRASTGAINWGNMLSGFPNGGAIASFSLADKTYTTLVNGVTTTYTFNYESNGPGISSLVVKSASPARIYGSTNHPMHFFGFDPATNSSIDYGGIPAVASGNFPAFGVNGNYVVGASYAAGGVYEYNTSQTWNVPSSGASINPLWLNDFPEVTRPRVALNLPGGKILFGGYGGYGVTGGGLITYDASLSPKATVKTMPQMVVPSTDHTLDNHSTVSLALLNSTTVIGGTSIEAPGGGTAAPVPARLYKYDIATKTITSYMTPIANARSIFSVLVGPDGYVYGLTDNKWFFVVNPSNMTLVHSANWSTWGLAFSPGSSLWNAPNGRVGVILPDYVLDVPTTSGAGYLPRKLATLPTDGKASGGGVLYNNRLYYASGAKLWSVGLAPIVTP